MGNVQNQQLHIGGRDVTIKDQLGEGGFAFVYSVTDMMTGEVFALKRVLAQDQENKELAQKEIDILVRTK
jgi:serine/threonine protein kinase